MLRVKNEARWIARVLKALESVVAQTMVLDDHSTDETAAICDDRGALVYSSPFSELDEVRDKNWLLAKVKYRFPEVRWIIHIDGDEELTPQAQSVIQSITSQPPVAAGYALRILYLWDRPDQIRLDGIYANFHRGSLFNVERQPDDLRFESRSANGFHCGNLPNNLRGAVMRLPEGLLHYGYMHHGDRLRKFEFYNRNDPGNLAEDCYRHMVLGDLPEYPATMKTLHAGPLHLASL